MRKLDLSESVGALIALASKSQERLAEIEMKKQLGLTPAQWKVILVLNIMDGLTQKEIAEKINVDGSTLVPVIDKMEQSGLVERKADSKDRRNNRIFLTKKSESTVDSIIMIILQLRKIIYNGISEDEISSTKNVLKILIKNSDAASIQAKTSGKVTP
ncbi:MarR family transcriptional regulator [Nitrosotalea devaniterrae]|uniref:MarR family transcriptional regulator n=1 Tax=Nitrosotalea devaniterrae TaxID=1078905 RepID=A0A128A3Z5_9ARCH|nr:MarR family transcriptional regulator [Candidatus Nitrosotalea devanaterra]